MYLAVVHVMVIYMGKPVHAAAAPWQGVNILDTIVLVYVNILLLCQHIRLTEKIQGVVVNSGLQPNIIPHSTSVKYCVQSETMESLKPLTDKVITCFEAGATAMGCTMDFKVLSSVMLLEKSYCLSNNNSPGEPHTKSSKTTTTLYVIATRPS